MGTRRQIHANGHRAPLAYHGKMLLDPHRMEAYERAIRALVRPGDVVLDLGCGTGILAMLAARRGARVHAVESMPVATLARTLVEANGLADRVTVHYEDITEIAPIEPVDLIVSDFLGTFLVDDLMIPAVEAAGRWLKPTGRCCPSLVRLFLAPGDVTIREIEVWRDPFYGVDVSAAHLHALAQCHRVDVGPEAMLAPGAEYHAYTPPGPLASCDRTLQFTIARAGVLRGILGWFEATLAPGIVLATSPGMQTHWGQYMFPLPPTAVEEGDALQLQLSLVDRSGDPTWRWVAKLRRKDVVVLDIALEDDGSWLGESDE